MPAAKKLDPAEVAKMAAIGATIREMCDFFGCGHAHLNRHYQRIIEEGRASGILRAKGQVYRRAMDGSLTALQFYLTNVAGWSDRPSVAITNTLVQNAALHTPEAIKKHLVMLQQEIRAEALRQPQLPDASGSA